LKNWLIGLKANHCTLFLATKTVAEQFTAMEHIYRLRKGKTLTISVYLCFIKSLNILNLDIVRKCLCERWSKGITSLECII
uniref:Uncharacterized protein n=1 Tax=Amphimedon queenslandica TaxID=400682 RepID=A0A1X7U1G0_AMPQE